MIGASYSLTATERVLPRMAVDFTTASLDPRITFTRAGNTATVINSSGVIVGVNADLPRFDYNPTTLSCKGLLIEESRTNVLLNSLLNGTTLATQSVTVTAAARTLSFYGTGQIVLSGAHSATVIGTGAYPTRTTYTFTPSAGTLTLTVTGTVQFAQLETGSFATSFIPTAGAAVARNAELAVMTGTNFTDWFNESEGTLVVQASTSSSAALLSFQVSTDDNNRVGIGYLGTANIFRIRNGGVAADPANVTASASGYLAALAYKTASAAGSSNASAVVTSSPGTMTARIGASFGSNITGGFSQNGIIRRAAYYPLRLTNAEVQAFSKI